MDKLSYITRNILTASALVASLYACASDEPSCREGRIYKEGIGCVEEASSYDAGSSIDTLVAKDTSVPLKEDTSVGLSKSVTELVETYCGMKRSCCDLIEEWKFPSDGFCQSFYPSLGSCIELYLQFENLDISCLIKQYECPTAEKDVDAKLKLCKN